MTQARQTTTKAKKIALHWKESNQEPCDAPVWTSHLNPETAVDTPLDYFHRLVDTPLLEYIANQTNLYAAQTDIGRGFAVSPKELEQFIGMSFYMSLISVPGTRRYWSSTCRITQVSEVMPLRRWEEIKKYLHFADNSALPINPKDCLFKIRKVVDSIRENMKTIPIEQHLSVDEQIIPYKGRSGLKQYNPKKPKKWGYKLFCLAGASGIIYDFEVYCGAIYQPTQLLDISASSNVVLRLAERIPKNQNYKLFYDNWFCSPHLQLELARNGIHSMGTVRSNRVPGNGLLSDKSLKKKAEEAIQKELRLMKIPN